MLTILREKKLTCFSLSQGYTKIIFIIYICMFIIQRRKVGEGRAGLLQSDLRHLVASHKQGLLAEGVDEDHPRVPVVAVGWGAGL